MRKLLSFVNILPENSKSVEKEMEECYACVVKNQQKYYQLKNIIDEIDNIKRRVAEKDCRL